jgi:hypothetical protein
MIKIYPMFASDGEVVLFSIVIRQFGPANKKKILLSHSGRHQKANY